MTFPDRRLVLAVMTNISFADARTIALQIAEAFAASRPERWRRSGFSNENRALRGFPRVQ